MKNKNHTPTQKPKNFSIDELHQITKVDRWFLHGLANIAKNNALSTGGLTPPALARCVTARSTRRR